MPLFLFFNTQTMHVQSIVHNSIATYDFPKNLLHNLAGFEPRSFASEADTMSTAPPSSSEVLFCSPAFKYNF
jgi:hypothetical protein